MYLINLFIFLINILFIPLKCLSQEVSLSVGLSNTCYLNNLNNISHVKCHGFSQPFGFNRYINSPFLHDLQKKNTNYININDKNNFLTIKKISLSSFSICYLFYYVNKIKCTGWNIYGQAGLFTKYTYENGYSNHTENDNIVPYIDLGNDVEIDDITSGKTHICVINKINKKAKCIGDNLFGQLGIGSQKKFIGGYIGELGNKLPYIDLGTYDNNDDVNNNITTTTTTNSTSSHLEILYIKSHPSSSHTCVIINIIEKIKCWGSNYFNQLGYGDSINRGNNITHMGNNLKFIDLGIESKVKQIDVGHSFTCTLLKNDNLKCFGFGIFGLTGYYISHIKETGDNIPIIDTLLYDNNNNLINIKMISTGGDYYCILYNDLKTVKCIGQNSSGQLGQNDITIRGDSPSTKFNKIKKIDFGNLTTNDYKILSIHCGTQHSCVLFDNLKVKCWGNNYFSQLGLFDIFNKGDNKYEMGDYLPFSDISNVYNNDILYNEFINNKPYWEIENDENYSMYIYYIIISCITFSGIMHCIGFMLYGKELYITHDILKRYILDNSFVIDSNNNNNNNNNNDKVINYNKNCITIDEFYIQRIKASTLLYDDNYFDDAEINEFILENNNIMIRESSIPRFTNPSESNDSNINNESENNNNNNNNNEKNSNDGDDNNNDKLNNTYYLFNIINHPILFSGLFIFVEIYNIISFLILIILLFGGDNFILSIQQYFNGCINNDNYGDIRYDDISYICNYEKPDIYHYHFDKNDILCSMCQYQECIIGSNLFEYNETIYKNCKIIGYNNYQKDILINTNITVEFKKNNDYCYHYGKNKNQQTLCFVKFGLNNIYNNDHQNVSSSLSNDIYNNNNNNGDDIITLKKYMIYYIFNILISGFFIHIMLLTFNIYDLFIRFNDKYVDFYFDIRMIITFLCCKKDFNKIKISFVLFIYRLIALIAIILSFISMINILKSTQRFYDFIHLFYDQEYNIQEENKKFKIFDNTNVVIMLFFGILLNICFFIIYALKLINFIYVNINIINNKKKDKKIKDIIYDDFIWF